MLPSPHHAAFSDYYLNPENRGVITGSVLNLPENVDREKLISYRIAPIQFQDNQEFTSSVSKDGSFSIQLPPSIPLQEVWIWMGDIFYTQLLFRSEIHLEIDFASRSNDAENEGDHPKVVFSGPDVELGEVYRNRIELRAKDSIWFGSITHDTSLSTNEKQERMDATLATLRTIDEKLLVGKSNETAHIINNNRLTEYLSESCTLYWGKSIPLTLKKKYLAHSPLTNIENFYHYFFALVESDAIMEVMKKNDCSRLEAYDHPLSITFFLETVDKEYPPARADLMKLYLERKDPVKNIFVLEVILKNMTTPWCIERVQSRLEQMREEVNKISKTLARKIVNISPRELGENLGQLDFGADLYAANATTGQALFDQLRGAFPGKFIYLDLWAVWCGPCLQQLPFSKKVHKATTDLHVEFVYLCTERGSDQEQWQNVIASHQVPGTHLLVQEATHSELKNLLKGRGYPTYALIKPDGAVVYDVPWPSGLNREKLENIMDGDKGDGAQVQA